MFRQYKLPACVKTRGDNLKYLNLFRHTTNIMETTKNGKNRFNNGDSAEVELLRYKSGLCVGNWRGRSLFNISPHSMAHITRS